MACHSGTHSNVGSAHPPGCRTFAANLSLIQKKEFTHSRKPQQADNPTDRFQDSEDKKLSSLPLFGEKRAIKMGAKKWLRFHLTESPGCGSLCRLAQCGTVAQLAHAGTKCTFTSCMRRVSFAQNTLRGQRHNYEDTLAVSWGHGGALLESRCRCANKYEAPRRRTLPD